MFESFPEFDIERLKIYLIILSDSKDLFIIKSNENIINKIVLFFVLTF